MTPSARGMGAELAEQGDVGAAGDAGLGDQQAGRGRDDQRRDLRHQAVADGQQRVGVRGLAEAHAHLADADDQPADQVDDGDQQAGDGIAADELGGTVHGAEEAALLLQLRGAARAPPASSISPADRSASIAICLPGMASSEKRAATSAMRPEPLVMTTKFTITRMREHDQADHDVALHDEAAERLDHVPGGAGALDGPRPGSAGSRRG